MYISSDFSVSYSWQIWFRVFKCPHTCAYSWLPFLSEMPISQLFYFSTAGIIFSINKLRYFDNTTQHSLSHTRAREVAQVFIMYMLCSLFCERICVMFLSKNFFHSDCAEYNFDIAEVFVWLKSQAQWTFIEMKWICV